MRNFKLEAKLLKPRFKFEPTIDDKQNYDLLTKNIWKVNREETFDLRLKVMAQQEDANSFFEMIENKEKNIKEFTLFFDAKNNIYSLKNSDFEEIGIFKTIDDLNFLMKNKENTQNVEILLIDENRCILNFEETEVDYYIGRFKEIYFFDTLFCQNIKH